MLARPCVALLSGLALWLLSSAALAQARVDLERMIANLRNGSDFRVRTQAALALGASKSGRAMQPLCGGLADSNTTVRAASAAALGKLQQGGADCLERRLASESSQTVKSAIEKALERVRGGGEPVFGPDSKYYVAIGKTTDKSGRSGDVIDRMVRSAMASAAGAVGIVLAPQDETPADAKRRLKAHRGVRGFYLSPRLGSFDYSGENLKVRLEIAIFTYPEKALLGNYAKTLTQQGMSGRDQDSEDELVKMCAERAMVAFSSHAQNIR
jgi:hypothetical protein